MKKLMIAFSAALIAGICAADISSSNVVGYNQAALRANLEKGVGNMFFSVGNTDMKVGDLKVAGIENDEGEGETVSFKILDGYGRATDGKRYFWYEMGTPGVGTECVDWYYGWYNGDGDKSYNDDPLPAGDAVWAKTTDAKYTIQCAGEVPAGPVQVTLRANLEKMVANPMPATLNLGNDVWVSGITGDEGEGETVSFKILDGYGRATDGKRYFWYEMGTPGVGTECVDWYYGWYNGDGDKPYNDESLNAGDGIWTKTTDVKFKINFKSPIQKDAE